MRAATRSQIRSIEKHTFNEYGMPSIVLMERAGQAVADAALNIADEDAEDGTEAALRRSVRHRRQRRRRLRRCA